MNISVKDINRIETRSRLIPVTSFSLFVVLSLLDTPRVLGALEVTGHRARSCQVE